MLSVKQSLMNSVADKLLALILKDSTSFFLMHKAFLYNTKVFAYFPEIRFFTLHKTSLGYDLFLKWFSNFFKWACVLSAIFSGYNIYKIETMLLFEQSKFECWNCSATASLFGSTILLGNFHSFLFFHWTDCWVEGVIIY